MPVAPPPLDPEVERAVRLYAERVEELVAKCAATQHRDPEAFLWNGRRVLEAACHLTLTVKRGNVSRVSSAAGDGSLSNLIQELFKAGAIDTQDRTRLTAAREQSNLGVHIRQPERENYEKACEDLAHLLPGIIDWLYDESPAGPYLVRSAHLTNALIDIRGEERVAVVTAPIRIALPRDPPASSRGAGRVLAGLLAAGGALVLGAGTVRMVASGSLVAPDLEVAAPAAPAAARLDPPAAVDAAPAAPRCPQGMIFVAATTLRLGQPEGGRGGWPAPTGPIPEVEQPAFCVDPGPRTRAQALAISEGAPRLQSADCQPTPDEALTWQPATCVSQAEAASACAAMVPGGGLPSLLQWEALARAALPSSPVRVASEWASDPFPASILQRGPHSADKAMFRQDLPPESRVKARAQGNMLHSWNHQHTSARLRRLGFRCAADPLPSSN